LDYGVVPPSGGSLEIGNFYQLEELPNGSLVPPSGGSLEIGNKISCSVSEQHSSCSPFGGIPRNWKLTVQDYHGLWSRHMFPLRGDP